MAVEPSGSPCQTPPQKTGRPECRRACRCPGQESPPVSGRDQHLAGDRPDRCLRPHSLPARPQRHGPGPHTGHNGRAKCVPRSLLVTTSAQVRDVNAAILKTARSEFLRCELPC